MFLTSSGLKSVVPIGIVSLQIKVDKFDLTARTVLLFPRNTRDVEKTTKADIEWKTRKFLDSPQSVH